VSSNRSVGSLKPVSRVVVSRPSSQEFLADHQQPVDIRIYVSPKGVAVIISVLVVVSRLVEVILDALYALT
jgi:hypothetical protein